MEDFEMKMTENTDADSSTEQNPLATEDIKKLLVRFAVPSIISFLVGALYNIVDQIFIGRGVGILGNAATNVAFPLNTLAIATALLLGIGTAANFNLHMGAGDKEKASNIAGNGISLLAICGTLLGIIAVVFLEPLVRAFGASDEVLPYALEFTGITSMGLPFLVFSTGCSHLIRADGSPRVAMWCVLTGAIVNTVLDPLFIFTFDMGIAGGAWATVIGQAMSAVMAGLYFRKFKTVHLTRTLLRPRWSMGKLIASLGAASCFNQLAMMVVQITMNNVLTYYGNLSHYGRDIPLACVGIIMKVNTLFLGVMLGISQGCQPIVGFNYGAKNYERVKKTYLTGVTAVTIVSVVAFLCFQILPREIISVFGQGNEVYYEFATRYFRIFMLFTFINGLQPITANFFTSIGKAQKGIFISLTRQVLFLLPLTIVFPMFMGIDGVVYAGPIADGAAALVAFILVYKEIKHMGQLKQEQEIQGA